MNIILKILGGLVTLVLPFVVVIFCVWIGGMFGLTTVVSSAAAVGLMVIGTGYEMKERFTAINTELKVLSERIDDVYNKIDQVNDRLDPHDPDYD